MLLLGSFYTKSHAASIFNFCPFPIHTRESQIWVAIYESDCGCKNLHSSDSRVGKTLVPHVKSTDTVSKWEKWSFHTKSHAALTRDGKHFWFLSPFLPYERFFGSRVRERSLAVANSSRHLRVRLYVYESARLWLTSRHRYGLQVRKMIIRNT